MKTIEMFVLRIFHLFVGHDEHLNFSSNIHGDAIESFNGKRSIWECPSCGAAVLKDELHDSTGKNE